MGEQSYCSHMVILLHSLLMTKLLLLPDGNYTSPTQLYSIIAEIGSLISLVSLISSPEPKTHG